MKNPNLGRTATDKVTGFTGVVVSSHDYVTGCTQYGIQPKVKEGEPGVLPGLHFLDEARLEFGDVVITQADVQEEGNPGCTYRANPGK